MTAEQNIIAAAVDLAKADDRYHACLAEFHPESCSDLANMRDTAVAAVAAAVFLANIDVRNPAVWDKWRKGQGFND